MSDMSETPADSSSPSIVSAEASAADEAVAPESPPSPSSSSSPDPDLVAGRPADNRRSWRDGAAAQYVTLFLWIAFFDQIGARALPLGGFFWTVAGAAIGAILCAWLFAVPAALLGWRTNQGFIERCELAFGVYGARRGIGLALIASQIVIFALAVHYGLDLAFRGLDRAGYLEPGAADEAWRGHWVYPFAALAWCVTFGLIGMAPSLAQLIMTVTRNYAVFPALILGGVLVWALIGMRDMDLSESFLPKTRGAATSSAGWLAVLATIQWQLAFFATFAAFAVDWGRIHRTQTDVKLSGWIGVGGSSVAVSLIALTTMSILGRSGEPSLTWRAVAVDRLQGWPSAIASWTFAVGSMIVAIDASQNWTVAWRRIAPRVGPSVWVSVGTICALPIILTSARERVDVLFGVIAALIAPALGVALANSDAKADADANSSPPAIRWDGVSAWVIGIIVGLIGPMGALVSTSPLPRLSAFPATLGAFLTGFAVFKIVGRERRAIEPESRS